MLFSLTELEARKIRFETAFQPGELNYLEGKVRQEGPLETEGVAELLGATEEIRVQGRFKVVIVSECDRCLETARFPLEETFDLFYRPALEDSEVAEERGLDDGAIELGFYEPEGLKLEEILQEQVLLALPMQRVCSADCKGICPVCGKNRNQNACNCEATPADDRWSVLKNWKQPE